MLGHSFNPIDELLDKLNKNRNLITAEHIQFLRNMVGVPKDTRGTPVGEKSTVNELLGTLTSMVVNLKDTAREARDPDAFKSVIGSIEKVMSMMNKYTEQVSAEEQMKALQDTIMETVLETLGEDARDRFLAVWKAKIDLLA